MSPELSPPSRHYKNLKLSRSRFFPVKWSDLTKCLSRLNVSIRVSSASIRLWLDELVAVIEETKEEFRSNSNAHQSSIAFCMHWAYRMLLGKNRLLFNEQKCSWDFIIWRQSKNDNKKGRGSKNITNSNSNLSQLCTLISKDLMTKIAYIIDNEYSPVSYEGFPPLPLPRWKQFALSK